MPSRWVERNYLTSVHRGVTYLGFVIHPKYVSIHPKKVKSFKERIKQLTLETMG